MSIRDIWYVLAKIPDYILYEKNLRACRLIVLVKF